MRTFILLLCFCFSSASFSQKFTLIKDSINPIVSDTAIRATYFGTSWTDINNDDQLDLFYAGTIYKNLGNGNFEIAQNNANIPRATALVGCSWADYENDGDLDLIYSRFSSPGTFQTRIYKNSNGQFTEVNTILNTINSATWSVQWCDYNNDSYIDFILTFADLFLGSNRFPNRLYRGNSDGTFTEVNAPYEFLTEKAAYTVSNWTDYDEDGDTDLFIASGPASGPTGIKPDFLFKNLQIETGKEGFQKLTNADISFAEDPQDGQCYNVVDYDNDGDLDICLTNYSGVENKFYINNSGAYTNTTTPFTINNTQNLTNAWGDFDNDSDLDLIVTASTPTGSGYFINNGDGTFTESNVNLINTETSGNSTGATIGDYDNDGDLDFFVVGQGIKGLFRNDLAIKNHFTNIKLIGNPSNKAGLGARLVLTTKIKGKLVTQKREISASNTFMGHNSLRAHFGLAKAKKIDELTIYWPSGNVSRFKNLRVNTFYTIEEGKKKPISPKIKKSRISVIVYPNPAKNVVKAKVLNIKTKVPIKVEILNANGTIITEKTFNYNEKIVMNTATLIKGNYFLSIKIDEQKVLKKFLVR
ncbi:T9SS C-terminal target domain-containing protein [Aquimarina sp. AD10]|uniref:FG-GAP-like repeat-containing protein n=1 Tax=Aquimarina sp. AD10 TaxID=1714849 RepID=UPI000E4DA483|nr:FG-GAP-like repeat-containing protein [Aquimarina sp. AD10]AXT60890.1 T9SS C-terminal target domain-containing protein [Aquimarina sp. AD10]RKM93033.1 T9SS C-terminal target domain-containing protein [Aquimarina sp. AD10]